MPTICNFTKNKIFQQVFFKSFLYGYRTIFLQQLYLTTYLPTYLPTYLQLVGRPTNGLTDRSTNRPTSQSLYIHIHINIASFTAGSIVDRSMKEKEHVVTWKTCFYSFKKQKHRTKNDISNRKTCHSTIWTLGKLGSIF